MNNYIIGLTYVRIGVGGNAIQFAISLPIVFALELDPSRIALAKHNANVYGVSSKIEFVIGDCTVIAPRFRADVVFLSPPWGGPDYLNKEVFDIGDIKPNGFELFSMSRKITSNVIYFLPRNTEVNQLVKLIPSGENLEVEENYINNKLSTLTVYYLSLIHI
eukprot:TRINITY_DN14422_c0_g1_i1.p1 TRINITY_DN14422_c0_g1~~TRINITY_DN14422_c0_g1_i1.p1  ORF type:complete len:162 (-),score=24.35 TRINITY_DN14422_c0_g1_i1:13-498(-)